METIAHLIDHHSEYTEHHHSNHASSVDHNHHGDHHDGHTQSNSDEKHSVLNCSETPQPQEQHSHILFTGQDLAFFKKCKIPLFVPPQDESMPFSEEDLILSGLISDLLRPPQQS